MAHKADFLKFLLFQSDPLPEFLSEIFLILLPFTINCFNMRDVKFNFFVIRQIITIGNS